MDYEERFVAYIDILGFEDLIDQSVEPSPSITPAEIKEALKVPIPVGKDIIVFTQIGDISDSGHRMTAFSDCVAITTLPTEKGLFHLVHHASVIGFNLFQKKLLCRGGITRGLIYNDEDATFGPAMNEAVNMEKYIAQQPRIILNPDVVTFGLQGSLGKFFARFIRKDDDGCYYVHILRVLRFIMDCETEPPADIRDLCKKINEHLKNEIDRLPEKELKKVLWFKKYFDWAQDRSALDSLKGPAVDFFFDN
ncbi:MAG: hypothetical protein ACHQ2F_02895 [Desulfobaccales bacterium]